MATHISEPFVGKAQGRKELIAVSTPVMPTNGDTPMGVLLFTLTLTKITQLVQSAPISEGSDQLKVVVVNERGQLVVHETNPLFTEKVPAIWDPVVSGNHLEDPLVGATFLFGQANVDRIGWTVTVLQDQRAAVKLIESLVNDVTQFQRGVVGFVMTLVILLAGMILTMRQRKHTPRI